MINDREGYSGNIYTLGQHRMIPKVEEKKTAGKFGLVYLTLERFFDTAGTTEAVFFSMIGLIATDEAHLTPY